MLDQTVKKGDLYQLPTGIKMPAACDGLAHEGRIISVASMVGALTTLGWTCKRPREKENYQE